MRHRRIFYKVQSSEFKVQSSKFRVQSSNSVACNVAKELPLVPNRRFSPDRAKIKTTKMVVYISFARGTALRGIPDASR